MRLSAGKLLCAIAIISLCEPLGLYSNEVIHPIYSVCKIISLCYAIFLVASKNCRVDGYIALVISWGLFMLIPTLANGGNWRVWFREFYMYSSIIIVVQYWIRRDTRFFLKICSLMFCIILAINYITFIQLGPDIEYNGSFGGTGINYLIGGRIRIGDWTITALAITALHGRRKKLYGFRFLITALTAALFIFGNWVSTSVLCIFLFFILLLFLKNEKVIARLAGWSFFGSVLICILTIIFRFQNKFSWLIVDLLREDLTLNGRTTIWDAVINQILNSPIIGHGYGASKAFLFYHSEYVDKVTSAAHNQYLAWLYDGGIISFIMCALIIIVAVGGLKRSNNIQAKKILAISLAIYFILMIPEVACNNTSFFLFLTVIRNGYCFNKENYEINQNIQPENRWNQEVRAMREVS